MPRSKHVLSKELLTMLTTIDLHSSVAVYSQLENNIQFAVASGRLKPGDRLPSVRELSERVQVNPNTVAKVYRDLEVMGLLFTRRGMGVFIKDSVQSSCREDCRRKIIRKMHEVMSEAKAAGMTPEEVSKIVDKSLAATGPTYGPTPNNILQLAR
jgi:GntR family transcriptional regulator